MRHRNSTVIDAGVAGFVLFLVVLGVFGQIPWWIAPAYFTYTLRIPMRIPWFGHHNHDAVPSEFYAMPTKGEVV